MPGAKIVDVCQQGDKLIEEEIAKVYRGKKITKGWPHARFHAQYAVLWLTKRPEKASLTRPLSPLLLT